MRTYKNGFYHKEIRMYLIFIISLFLVSCKPKEQKLDPLNVCSKFYELNKDLNFNELFNVHILGIREHSEYDNSVQKIKYNRIPVVIGIDDPISKKNIKLPVFSKNADLEEKKIFFARCDSSHIEYIKSKYKIISKDDIFKSYTREVESIYSSYYQIKVPDELPYKNIEVIGCNNYIEFILYKDEEKMINYRCYYVKNTIFTNDRRSEYFNKLPKFDNHWYYDLNW